MWGALGLQLTVSLVLCSGITVGGVQGTVSGARDPTQVHYMQVKYPTCAKYYGTNSSSPRTTVFI